MVEVFYASSLRPGFAAWRLCVRVFFQPIDNGRDAVFDEGHLEVDGQAKTLAGRPQPSQKLLLVDWGDQLDGFDFDDDLVLDEQARPESSVDTDTLMTTGSCWLTARRPRRPSSYARTV